MHGSNFNFGSKNPDYPTVPGAPSVLDIQMSLTVDPHFQVLDTVLVQSITLPGESAARDIHTMITKRTPSVLSTGEVSIVYKSTLFGLIQPNGESYGN